MKYRAEIEVSDSATWAEIEEAKIGAKWEEIYTLPDRMNRTDLTNKCGSCKYFEPCADFGFGSHGFCNKGRAPWRPRSTPKCKDYERKPNEQELRSNYSP